MSIYVTGDTHGDYDIKSIEEWEQRVKPGPQDYLAICGDWGAIWINEYGFIDTSFITYWEKKPYNILVVDGNHDNHNALAALEPCLWGGDVAGHIAHNIVHLQRGGYYEVNGITLWVFGGAESIDKQWRTEGLSYWKEEMATPEQMERGWNALKAHDSKVDYILTHDCPWQLYAALYGKLGGAKGWNYHNQFLGDVAEAASFKKWYFGHHHIDMDLGQQYVALYNKVLELGESHLSYYCKTASDSPTILY